MSKIVVVGGGAAGLSAALAAQEQGAEVVLLERAPYEERGGNSRFAVGSVRLVYNGIDDIQRLVPDLTADEIAKSDFGTYTRDDFIDDMARVTHFRTDPDLMEVLVDQSFETACWLRSCGIRFLPAYGWQSFQVDGKTVFTGGAALEFVGGGAGLVEGLLRTFQKRGGEVLYGMRAMSLLAEQGAVVGLVVRQSQRDSEMRADAVILASGGFEANTEWRTRYLGPNWDLAKVRGTRFNTGDGIRMALEAGAVPTGHWSGCHSVSWELHSSEFGDHDTGNTAKNSFQFGVMINSLGRRFVDEGSDFRDFTYSTMGGVVLEQPGQFAWQVFDSKVAHLLREEYRGKRTTRVQADSLAELAGKLDGVDPEAFLETIASYNTAVRTGVPFDPKIKDGKRTDGIDPQKSNWANRLDTPPFEAHAVTCGITFTYGGVKIDTKARVVDTEGAIIRGLYAAGEMVGGLFYFSYPAAAGLTSSLVFGRLAGNAAMADVVQ